MSLLFNNYRSDSEPLKKVVRDRLVATNVYVSNRVAVFAMLAPLEAKREVGEFHRDHSFRVGLLCADIAKHENVDERALLLAGLLHDVGKALVPSCTLCATERWTAEDRKAMEPHVADGFRLLRDRFDFTAQVILWHHWFQVGGYPAMMPDGSVPSFSGETLERAKHFGALLMVADVFDAMHRVNTSTGDHALSAAEIRDKMFVLQPEILGDLVSRLYVDGVLK